jgi:hypothetical protein
MRWVKSASWGEWIEKLTWMYEQVSVKDSERNTRQDVHIFQCPSMKARLKYAFSKAVAAIKEIDPILGTRVLDTWKDWRLAETDIRGNFDEQTLEEYVKARDREIGYP